MDPIIAQHQKVIQDRYLLLAQQDTDTYVAARLAADECDREWHSDHYDLLRVGEEAYMVSQMIQMRQLVEQSVKEDPERLNEPVPREMAQMFPHATTMGEWIQALADMVENGALTMMANGDET